MDRNDSAPMDPRYTEENPSSQVERTPPEEQYFPVETGSYGTHGGVTRGSPDSEWQEGGMTGPAASAWTGEPM